MKKVYIILIIVAGIIIAGGLWYFTANNSNNQTITKTENTTTPQKSLLTVIHSDVQAKEKAEAEFKDVTAEHVDINDGASVKTSLTGRATIESPNQTTTVVDKNSQFTVVSLAENKTKINLEVGSLWAKVKKVFGKGEYYQVETSNSVATVRGTSFGISYNNNKTTVMVTESKVSLISVDPVSKHQIGNEVFVEAGHKATIITGYAPQVQLITDSDKKLEWYIFNNENGTIVPFDGSNPSSTDEPAPKETPAPGSIPSTTYIPKPNSGSTSTTNPTNQNPEYGTTPSPNQPAAPSAQAPKSELYSVTPNTVYVSRGPSDFAINGQSLGEAKAVFLDQTPLQFSVYDSKTIIATVTPETQIGTYDVSVVFSNGNKLTLYKVLSVRQ